MRINDGLFNQDKKIYCSFPKEVEHNFNLAYFFIVNLVADIEKKWSNLIHKHAIYSQSCIGPFLINITKEIFSSFGAITAFYYFQDDIFYFSLTDNDFSYKTSRCTNKNWLNKIYMSLFGVDKTMVDIFAFYNLWYNLNINWKATKILKLGHMFTFKFRVKFSQIKLCGIWLSILLFLSLGLIYRFDCWFCFSVPINNFLMYWNCSNNSVFSQLTEIMFHTVTKLLLFLRLFLVMSQIIIINK